MAEIMKHHSNIYFDISGSLLHMLAIEGLVEFDGDDRVIYGSKLINLDARFDFGRVVFSPLPDIKKRYWQRMICPCQRFRIRQNC
jgi:hypothetical protein